MLEADASRWRWPTARCPKRQISGVMNRMVDGEMQVLVCTTIIETGIDIPNVNTLIIEDADHMGLAQLHQIRGRVGRSTAGPLPTSPTAGARSSLRWPPSGCPPSGSSPTLAPASRSPCGTWRSAAPATCWARSSRGNLMSVGYDMYLKLLEEAVLEEKGETPERTEEVTADLVVSANIPDFYVPSAEQRMDLYRRIAHIRSEADADDLVDELIDRYGDPPRPVNNLISVALLRATAATLGIQDIAQKGDTIRFTLKDFDVKQIARVSDLPPFKKRIVFAPDKNNVPVLTLKLKPKEDPLAWSRKLLDAYAQAAPQPKPEESGD